MRLLLLLITLITTIYIPSMGQPIVFDWSKSLGGKNNMAGMVSIDKDASGNVYVMGQFSGTRAFGGTQLTALGSTDIFIVKLSQFGQILWAIRGGASFSSAQAGDVSVNGNYLYITGSFTNFIAIGANCSITGAAANKNAFFASLNTADGTCNWVVKGEGANDIIGVTLTPATGGGFYAAGTFTGTADFGGNSLSTSSIIDADIFYAKYNATGTPVWVKKLGGLGTDNVGSILEISSNQIVMNGGFEDVLPLTSGNITSLGFLDFYLVKFNNLGIVTWGARGGGIDSDGGLSLGVDTSGNIYSTGTIGNNVTFGSIYLPIQQNINIFVSKHNSSGVCQWVKTGGTLTDDVGQAIATDPNGSSYVTGYVSGNATFGTTTLTGVQGYDSYVAKYNTFGTLVWITKIGSSGNDIGKTIVYDVTGACFTAGEFNATLSLSINPISPPTGMYGVYVTRVGGGSVGLNELTENIIVAYPNPTSDEIILNLEKITDAAFTVEVLDIEGRVIQSELLQQQDATSNYRLNLQNMSAGKYIIKVSSSRGDQTTPVMVIRD